MTKNKKRKVVQVERAEPNRAGIPPSQFIFKEQQLASPAGPKLPASTPMTVAISLSCRKP